jgi:hypothetical protein
MSQTSKSKPLMRKKMNSASPQVMFSTLIDPEKYKSLRLLSVQLDIEIKQLVDEALALLFAKHANSIPTLPKQS